MSAMAEQCEEKRCITAFINGNKCEAEQLLPCIRTAVAKKTFQFRLRRVLTAALVSLLHVAAFHGWLDVVTDLITSYSCEANCKDDDGRTPLHYAAYNGHLEVVTYFITKQRCHPMTTNKYGWTPLHIASSNGHLNIIQYLISELQCDPSVIDNCGRTPLHYACSSGHVQIVKYLLSTGKVDPVAEDKYGHTPVYWARKSGNSCDLLKLFHPFEQCKRDFPVHTFTKLILTGYSGAGKTTVAQLLVRLATRRSSDIALGCVAEVQRLTAGIIPFHIESKLKEITNMVLYDFAGQQEYYSSHTAVLEHVMQRSAAIFVSMVNLSQSKEEICESVQYWLSFAENACSTAEVTSHVVIIGSHADMVNSSQELEEKSSLVQKIAVSRVKQLRYVGFVRMDCRQSDTHNARQLISLLSSSQQAILANQPSITVYCHKLYAFLCTKLKKTGCTLQQLTFAITAENDSSLPSDLSVLTEFLTTLSSKGLILFMKNKENPPSGWVVVEKEALVREVNGTLFAAPEDFKEHHKIASNTGIVPTASLQKLFPQHSLEMLVRFLTSMEFCNPVDSSVLQYTNLQITSAQTAAEGLLFFPGLIQLDRPGSLTQGDTLCFGWCLGCLDPQQFFSSRFLHVLLLCVAYTFPLSVYCNPASSPLRELQRRCTVWRNGISWSDDNGITAVIEVINKNRWVVVAMSHSKDRPVEHAKLRNALISLVRYLQQEHCPNLVCECLISPTLVQQYPFNDLPDTDLFDIRDVARSILCRKPFIPSCNKDRRGRLATQSLPFEPYYLLSPSSVCQLFDSSKAEQPVPASLLQEVQRHCHQPQLKPQNHKKLRECVNGLSIFTGRNPLEVAELKEEDIISHTAATEPLTAAAPPSAPPGDPLRSAEMTGCVNFEQGRLESSSMEEKKEEEQDEKMTQQGSIPTSHVQLFAHLASDLYQTQGMEEQFERTEKKMLEKKGHDIGVQASFLEIFSEVFLRGVEVCGETVLKVVGNRSDELKWSDYGFSLEVPGGALPFGETANVAVKVILSGQFQLPEHYQQISAIYYISASEDFLEEVIVNHQYCAVTRSEEERSRLRIIIAKSPQNKLPYRFRVQKGVFNPDPQYASIKMKQFSKPFMVGAIAPETIERSYIALKYKQVPRSNFILSIAHNLKPVWKYVKEHHQEWQLEGEQTICFEDGAITLDLPDSQSIVVYHSPSQLTKSNVKQQTPCCSLDLGLTGGDGLKPILHRVTLKSVDHFFYIQAAEGRDQATTQVPLSTGGKDKATQASLSTGGRDQATTQALPSLKMCDLLEVAKSLIDLLEWKRLGLELGLLYPTLGKIDTDNHHNTDNCKMAMLAAWLEQTDEVLKVGVPSWSVLQAALTRMGKHEMAAKITPKCDRGGGGGGEGVETI